MRPDLHGVRGQSTVDPRRLSKFKRAGEVVHSSYLQTWVADGCSFILPPSIDVARGGGDGPLLVVRAPRGHERRYVRGGHPPPPPGGTLDALLAHMHPQRAIPGDAAAGADHLLARRGAPHPRGAAGARACGRPAVGRTKYTRKSCDCATTPARLCASLCFFTVRLLQEQNCAR